MNQVRIALVGCGTIAHAMHLVGIKTMADMGKVDLVAVCDIIEERARVTSEKFSVPQYYTDLDRMLGETEFDLLVDTTPIPSHFEVNLCGLQAGKHVYTQKPMTTTVEEATVLIEEARQRGLKLGCAPEHTVRPLIRQIKKLIAEGAIGQVAFAKVKSSHDGPEKHDVPRDSTWYYQPGSSPILDMGVHGLNQITSILGPARRLTSFSGRNVPTREILAGPFRGKTIEVNIDDNSLLLLDFGDDRFVFLDATYCVMASMGPRMEIYGSEGTIAVSENRREERPLYLYRLETMEWTQPDVTPAPPVRDLGVLHMVDCLLNDKPLELTGEHGRHLVEIMTQAPKTAAEGRTIELKTTF
jgi:predicted dehydrogenase